MKKNIISLIAIVMLVLVSLSNQVYAVDDIVNSGSDFLKVGKNEYNSNSPIDEGALKNTSNNIYNIFFAIAVVIAIAVGMIIGIQFVMGSVDEKAKIKETLVPYVVGCVVIFSAFTIWKLVMEIGNEVEAATPNTTISSVYDITSELE